MKLISSLDNRYIKLASSLQHRKYREENQMFLVEGRRAVAEALAEAGVGGGCLCRGETGSRSMPGLDISTRPNYCRWMPD